MYEPIFTNPQQENITILTDRRMIHSAYLKCPATKTEEKKVAQATDLDLPDTSDTLPKVTIIHTITPTD